jgi:hypothetical protein
VNGKWTILLTVASVAGCAPLCSPGTPDCHHTLTGWRYQPPYRAGFVDNCSGEVACGRGSLPTYQPDYDAVEAPQIPQFAPLPGFNRQLDPNYPVPGGRFNGVPIDGSPTGCPGIPLPGTNDCLLP